MSRVSRAGKYSKNIVDITDEHWNFILGVNATGLFYCVRAQLRVMDRGGSILNVASMAGLMGRPSIAAYSTSKHAAIGLTRTAAKEVGVRGIRVNALAPYVANILKIRPLLICAVDLSIRRC